MRSWFDLAANMNVISITVAQRAQATTAKQWYALLFHKTRDNYI